MSKDGGPAFPGWDWRPEIGLEAREFGTHALPVMGMSLRDWLAGQALTKLGVREQVSPIPWHDIAAEAYAAADAMLNEREKS